jgi:PAS domain S-box-containing protein
MLRAFILLILLQVLPCFAASTPPVEKLKSIRVVMDDNYPPYVFKDEQGELKGIIIDQWRLWEQKTGIRAEVNGMDWSEAQRRMQAGEFDVIDTIFRNEKREKIYDFTKAYATIPVPLFFHADISGIRGPEDLKGFMVAAKAGGNVLDILKKNGITSIAEYPSYEKIIEAARDGRIKVFTVDRPPALYFMNKLGIQDRFRETAPMYSGEFHRAVSKGNRELLTAVENGFAAISSAEYRVIDKRWMGTPVGVMAQLRYLWYAAGIVVAVGTVILAWLMMLKSAVRRKTVELAESEERYRSIIDNMQDVYYRSDAEGRFTMISPSGANLLGYDSTDQVLGRAISEDFYHESDNRAAFIHNLKMKGALYGYEIILKRRDGTPVQVATSSHLIFAPDGSFMGVEGVFRDITSQKDADEALRSSEQKFSKAFSHAPLLMTLSDIETGRYFEVNSKFCEISGFSQSETLGRTSLEIGWISSDERSRLYEIMKRNGRVQDIEVRLTGKDGKPIFCLYSAEIINIEGTGRLLSIAQDITQRKKDMEALDYANECFQQALNSSQHILYRLNVKKGCYDYMSPVFEKITGYPLASFMQTSLEKLPDYFHPDDRERVIGYIEKELSQRTAKTVNLDMEYRFRKADDSYCWFHDSNTACFNDQGELECFFGTVFEITDRLMLQQEREKGQRLESLGVLAGGIAHDFNNILTGIVGNLSLARRMVDSDHRAVERLTECEKAVQRASELTHQLLTFARGGEPVRKVVDLLRLVHEAVSFGLRGSNIKGVVKLDDNLWPVNVDEGQINQALNNLLINASQAMPDGGTVTVKGENFITKEPPELSGRFVRLTIQDTGSGIPADVLSKVFDPYFTTKPGGTGLGLASVYSIVTRHGGTVTVVSEDGHGTEFVICLPAADELVPQEQVDDCAPLSGRAVAERVLVMDDEEMILEVVSIMLAELGCAVDTCCDGAGAVARYQVALELGSPYDAVILDLTVPGGMGGLEASVLIRSIDPEAVLIVSSGYSNDAVATDLRGYGFSGAVMKPYSMESLTGELCRVMEERQRQSKV